MPEPAEPIAIKLPFGPWESFDACVADQKAAGHSDDAAKRICAALQDKLKASPDANVDQLTAEVVAELGLDRRIGGSPKLCGRPMWGAAIKLALAAEDVEPNKLVWVQVAKSGEWKGHAEGPFTLDRELFEELQRNLRAHVNYRAEPSPPDGRVIQWDFHHACEEHPALLAVEGAPAQGWIYDVALGDQVPKDELSEKAQAALAASEEAGVETFWALTEWLEPAASYVAAGKYQWSSIAIYPDSKDPITGEDVGWWFASCALTNRPFIEGMAPMSIAATRMLAAREPKRLGHYYDPWDVPCTIGEAFGRLKDILEMGELATVVDVAGELAKLKSYADGAAPPPGVDVDKLIHQIRQLLQLSLLTDNETIFAQCEELLARATAESQAAPPANNLATTREPMPDPVDPNKILLETIARRLKVPSKPEDVQRAILAELESGADAKEKLSQLYQALGVEDYQAAADRVIDNAKQIAQLEQIIPEMASLRNLQVEDEEKDVEDDMGMAASRFGTGWETIKDMVAHYRTGGVSLDKADPAIAIAANDTLEQRLAKLGELGRRLKARRAAKARFNEKLPRLPAGQEHLLTSVATSPTPKPGAGPAAPQQLAKVGADGTLRLVSQPAAAPSTVVAPAPPPGNGSVELSAVRAEVESHDGPNFGAQCIAYVQSKAQAAGQALSWEDAHARGTHLAAQLCGQAPLAS